jgi:antitoxin ParD1/3/4
MAEGVNVRFSGALKEFVEQRSGSNGLYGSASEYIRDLVRRDYESDEAQRWDSLHLELKAGMAASESDFVPLDTKSVLAEARRRREAGE